jgi:MoxR-like ATPase
MGNNNIELVKALDKIRLGNLYVHNDELRGLNFSTPSLKNRKVYLVETLAVINALVDRGTMLMFGGHGGGKTTLAKYLGQVFYKLSKETIEDCILRGHPQLTEEKILGSLDIAQLTRAKELNSNKKVDVIWNDFVDSPWKIIDELNRLSPYAQNILLSLLAESSVKYHNESKRLGNFSLYATMNPKDEGNFVMSLPFLDRFALALPITMPDYESLSTIGKKDKSSTTKVDELPTLLQDFKINEVQNEIRELAHSEEAELFINFLVSSYKLCDVISKESNEIINVEKNLCDNCRYNVERKACNKIVNPLSVRVKEDLYKYGKAFAWFLGYTEVSIEHIKAIAPFMIWHRSSVNKYFLQKYKDRIKNKKIEDVLFFDKIEVEATKEIVELIYDEFIGVVKFLKDFSKIKKGKLNKTEFDDFVKEVKKDSNDFLITKKQIIPILEKEYEPVYDEIIRYNNRIEVTKILSELNTIKDELSNRYDIPNRQFLADLIEKKRRRIGMELLSKFTLKLPYETLKESVGKECFELNRIIKSKFNDNLNLAFLKTESLSDIGDSEYSLTIERLNEGGGKSSLRFVYQGQEDHPVYIFLNKYNVV